MNDKPSYDISISADETSDEPADPLLSAAIDAALRRHSVVRATIEVAIVSDTRIAELNERFLSHSEPTDVLTFDLRANAGDDTGSSQPLPPSRGTDIPVPVVEAQIVVSFDTARCEATSRGHSVNAELGLYVVHGLLHLLGYNDHDETEAQRMHAMEDEILGSIGIGPVFTRPGA